MAIDQEWLEKCAQAGEFLYGMYPVRVLKQLYETKKGHTISERQVVDTMASSEAVLMSYDEELQDEFEDLGYPGGCFVPVMALEEGPLRDMLLKAREDGNPYAALHLDEDELWYLLDKQADKPFYIPKASEIESLVTEGYVPRGSMVKLEHEMTLLGKDPSGLREIWPRVSSGELDAMDAVQELVSLVLDGTELSLDQANEKIRYINDFMGDILHRDNRGWRPRELFIKKGGLRGPITIVPGSAKMAEMMREAEPQMKEMGIKADYSSIQNVPAIGPSGERTVVQVGRNDLCPCGSGKKYKKCHGR